MKLTFRTWNIVSVHRGGRRGTKCCKHNSRPSSGAMRLISYGWRERKRKRALVPIFSLSRLSYCVWFEHTYTHNVPRQYPFWGHNFHLYQDTSSQLGITAVLVCLYDKYMYQENKGKWKTLGRDYSCNNTMYMYTSLPLFPFSSSRRMITQFWATLRTCVTHIHVNG